MKDPSRHWINSAEFEHLTSGIPRKYLCRMLRRCDRTLRDWQSGRRPVPLWVRDSLVIHRLETRRAFREMFGHDPLEMACRKEVELETSSSKQPGRVHPLLGPASRRPGDNGKQDLYAEASSG